MSQGGTAGTPTAGTGGTAGLGGDGGGQPPVPTKTYVYVGGGEWAEGTGKVRAFQFDEDTAKLTLIEEITAGSLNSFLGFHPTLNVLYAADEAGKKLRAFSIDPATGKLTSLNEATTAGGPVYVSVDKTGKFAFVSFYNEGSVQVFSLEANGSIGSSVDTKSTGANAHSIVIDPTNGFVFVPNKGTNNISQFTLNAATGALTANTPASVNAQGGPRHLTFSPDGKFAYVITENDATIITFSYDSTAGTLTSVDTVAAAPANANHKQAADIHITPNGKYLYGTNRVQGQDGTIGMYSIGADGKLTNLGFESTHGIMPRNFAIHENGKLILVANHDSDNVSSYKILDDGKLEFIETTAINDPYWVGFLVLPE